MHRALVVSILVLGVGCAAGGGGPLDPGTGDPSGSPGLSPTVSPSPPPGPTLRDRCFPNLGDPAKGLPDYDQFDPVVGDHCNGTNHQDIQGIEKVVFLGDSITEGTPPTAFWEYYRNVLTNELEAKFGALEVENCAAWGARTDDLLLAPHQQILECFDVLPEQKRTLVVMTVGGNDMASFAEDGMNGVPMEEIMLGVEGAIQLQREAVGWFREDPARFPNGVFVVYANFYEFTDGTGDFQSCPGAALAGYNGSWPEGRDAYLYANEQYVKLAVDTDTDIIFILEQFCGHGFNADDPANECYRGPGTETWFDFTCIHPNPTGHAELAGLFMSVVNE